jgi:hypothetical protein
MNFLKSIVCCFVLLSSCTSWHYTDYGKPFDFLKSEKVYFKNTDDSKVNYSKLSSNHYNTKKVQTNLMVSNINQPSSVDFDVKAKMVDLANSVDKSEKKYPKKTSNKAINKKKHPKLVSLVNKKIENKIAKLNSNKKVSPLKRSYDDVSDVALLLICILFPPAAIWVYYGSPNTFKETFSIKELVIDFLVWLPIPVLIRKLFTSLGKYILPLFWSIAVCYAIYVCFLS